MIPIPAFGFLGSEGVAEALHYHRKHRTQRLINLIHYHLSVRLVLSDGSKMTRSDGLSIPKYEGSQHFKNLEDWLALLVIHFERSQYGGFDRDRECVLFIADYLKGRVLSWYTDHIVLVADNAMLWTFEEVVIGLYDQFVHPSAMEDARQDLEQVEYTPVKGVQGVYDEMLTHACNMAETPDNHMLVKLFLNVLPSDWQKQLFRQGLSPVVNQIHEFVGAAEVLEITDRTAQLYEQFVERHPAKRTSALRPVAAQRGSTTPQYKWKATASKLLISKQRFQRRSRDDPPKEDDNKYHMQAPERTRNTRDKLDQMIEKGRMQLEHLYASTVTSPGITHSNALALKDSQTS